MSDKHHDKQYAHRLTGVKRNSGRFMCNGTADPTVVLGDGFTVAYAGSNKYQITFDGPYRNLLAVHVDAANYADVCSLPVSEIVDGVYDLASFQVSFLVQDSNTKLFSASLPSAPLAGDGVWIHFSADFLDIGGN